jgi:hypothetical protein
VPGIESMNRRLLASLAALALLVAIALVMMPRPSSGQLGHGTFGKKAAAAGLIVYPD